MSSNASSTPSRRKGIYFLPNMLTLLALFAGYYSIVAAQRGKFVDSAVAMFLAMLLDALDGRVARMTNTETDFGAQLDSLSDMVSFGIAPALVLYAWSLEELGKFGWLASFLYAACVALRLARFNVRAVSSADKRYSQGLACTPAAGVVAGLIWIGADISLVGSRITYLSACIAVFLSLAMISNVPYRSFKDINLKENVPFIAIVAAVLVLVLVAVDPPKVLFLSFFIYAISGPVVRVWAFLRKRLTRVRRTDSQ